MLVSCKRRCLVRRSGGLALDCERGKMRRVNREVASCWAADVPAVNHKGTLTTDGVRLWSYKLLIGDTCPETGVKVLRDYTAKGRHGYKSQTTSCHVGLAARFAHLID